MKPDRDPPRLLDPKGGASSAVRQALAAAKIAVPTSADVTRLAARLPVGGGGTTGGKGGGPTAHAKAASMATPSTLSGAVIGAALGVAVVGGVWIGAPSSRPFAESAPARVETTEAPVAPVDPIRPPVVAPVPVRAADVAPTASNLEPPPAAPRDSSAPGAGDRAGVATHAEESEAQILQRAQDALAKSPAEALAITDVHVAKFPGGALAQEREVLAITALVASGRRADARARFDRFLAHFPGSAHVRRLEVIVGAKNDEGLHKGPGPAPSTP